MNSPLEYLGPVRIIRNGDPLDRITNIPEILAAISTLSDEELTELLHYIENERSITEKKCYGSWTNFDVISERITRQGMT